MRNALKSSKITLIAVFIMWGFSDCNKQETAQQKYDREQETLQKYIADNHITTLPTYTGLYYIETPPAGTGEKASYGRIVSVFYEGRLLDGTVFDSTDSIPFTFTVGISNVIPGWHEGLQLMRDGGKATLIIPSTLGYGPYGSGTIPPYTSLVFDIEVTNVQ